MQRLYSHLRRYRGLYLAAVFLIGISSAVPTLAAGEDAAVQTLYRVLSNIVIIAVQTVGNLTALMTHVLILVSSYGADGNGFINAEVVKTGWALIRDITNMFFIVALLMIAAGTILRIENYRYNRLLARVIIMAFLVNYSRLIAGFLIQTSQVVMLTFVNSYKEALFGNFASMFGLDKVLQFAENGIPDRADLGVILMSLIAGLGLMVVALNLTIAITVILVVRIVALWLLVILSPLAYALRILPNTEKYASRWWSEFGKYLTVGPVLAFFLWLALALVVSTGANTLGSVADQAMKYERELSGVDAEPDKPFANEILSLQNLTAFMISIIFLSMGLKYATDSGAAGAKLAGRIGTGVGMNISGMRALQDRTIRPMQSWYAARQSRSKEDVARRGRSMLARTDKLESATIGRVGSGIGAVRSAGGAALKEGLRQTKDVGGFYGKRIGGKVMDVSTKVGQEAIKYGTKINQERIAPSLGMARDAIVNMPGAQQVGGAVQTGRAVVAAGAGIAAQPFIKAAGVMATGAKKLGETRAGKWVGKEAIEGGQRMGGAFSSVGQAAAGGAVAGAVVGSRGERVRQKSMGELEEKEVADTETLARAEAASIADARKVALYGSDDRTRYAYARRMARKGELKKQSIDEVNDSDQVKAQKNQLNIENQSIKSILAKKDLELSDSGEELEKRTSSYDTDVRQDMFEGVGLKFNEGKRQMLATVGAIAEAFQTMDIAGKVKTDADAAGDYIGRNMNRVYEQVKKGIVSLQTVASQDEGKKGKTMLENIVKMPRMDDEAIIEGTKDKNWSDAFGASMAKLTAKRNREDDSFNSKTEKGRDDENLRKRMVLGARGGTVTTDDVDAEGNKIKRNAFDIAYEGLEATAPIEPTDKNDAQAMQEYATQKEEYDARVTEAQGNLERVIRTQGRHMTKFNFVDYQKDGSEVEVSDNTAKAFTKNISVNAMAQIFEKVPATVETVLDELRTMAADASGEIVADEIAFEKVRTAQRNDLLSGMVKHPLPPRKKNAGKASGKKKSNTNDVDEDEEDL